MMYSRKNLHAELCVLAYMQIFWRNKVLLLQMVNASSNYTRFFETSEGIKSLDKDSVFTENCGIRIITRCVENEARLVLKP